MPPSHMPNYMPGVGMDPQQALAYSSYVQQNRGQYMPQSGLQQHAGHQS
jgi:pheromone receptor transcription factor